MNVEDFPKAVNQFYKLRMIISKAWIPIGISRDEGSDILIWAIGKDVKTLDFKCWPERIMQNTGITFDPKEETIINILRRVAQLWQNRKVKPVYVGGL